MPDIGGRRLFCFMAAGFAPEGVSVVDVPAGFFCHSRPCADGRDVQIRAVQMPFLQCIIGLYGIKNRPYTPVLPEMR